MFVGHFSVLRIPPRPAPSARSPCVQPSSPSTLWGKQECSRKKVVVYKMLMPEVSQQDFSFNKGILTLKVFKANWGNTLFRAAEGLFRTPFHNPMQLKVYSTCTHPFIGAFSSRVDVKPSLCISGHPQSLPSLTLSTNNHWDHSSNMEVTVFHILYLTHSLPFSECPLHVRSM